MNHSNVWNNYIVSNNKEKSRDLQKKCAFRCHMVMFADIIHVSACYGNVCTYRQR